MTNTTADHTTYTGSAPAAPALHARSLGWQVPAPRGIRGVKEAARHIVRDVSLHVQPGQLVGLIGPNGSGKSTLLRMIYRVLAPTAGAVEIDGKDIWRMSARTSAQHMAVVAQQHGGGDVDFSVTEVVLMGRTPHKAALQADTQEDFALAQQAMQRTGVLHLAQRRYPSLSGGEKQRVLIARALAQQAGVLVLDEPTNHLDVRYQFEIMRLIRSLGLTSIAALHELHIAARYCDRLYLLQDGQLFASGTPAEVLTSAHLAQVYGVRAQVQTDASGRLHIEWMPDDD